MLSKEARIIKARYMREWRRKNPDKTKEYNERSWERKAFLAAAAAREESEAAKKQEEA